ncbi:MAG: ankyrin repeat domain-containing protein [Micavibrio sp.]|nr:ankyrin repeat domain-containing protein [Micavibrio sp.]
MGMFSSKTPQQKANILLQKALENSDLKKLQRAIAEGAEVNRPPGVRYFSTPLYRAVQYGFDDGAYELLKAGADARAPQGEDNSLIYRAAYRGNLSLVTRLVDAGAEIDAQAYDGSTGLHAAARGGYGNIIRFLMERGADVNARDRHMNTPADVAEKDYPRLSDLIRGKLDQQKLLEPTRNEWSLTGTEEVARVSIKDAIGYRMTEIFNFNAGLYTQISRNLETNAESQAFKALASLDEKVVTAARAALLELGGTIPVEDLKPRLTQPKP